MKDVRSVSLLNRATNLAFPFFNLSEQFNYVEDNLLFLLIASYVKFSLKFS
jgi:hypothetical protein